MVTEVICDDMNTYIPSKTVSRKAGDGLMTSADDELAVKDASITNAKNTAHLKTRTHLSKQGNLVAGQKEMLK